MECLHGNANFFKKCPYCKNTIDRDPLFRSVTCPSCHRNLTDLNVFVFVFFHNRTWVWLALILLLLGVLALLLTT